jgi:hypothetical protein
MRDVANTGLANENRRHPKIGAKKVGQKRRIPRVTFQASWVAGPQRKGLAGT